VWPSSWYASITHVVVVASVRTSDDAEPAGLDFFWQSNCSGDRQNDVGRKKIYSGNSLRFQGKKDNNGKCSHLLSYLFYSYNCKRLLTSLIGGDLCTNKESVTWKLCFCSVSRFATLKYVPIAVQMFCTNICIRYLFFSQS